MNRQAFIKQHIDKLFATIVFFTALQLHSIWLQRNGYDTLYMIARSADGRPSVYRALIPYLSQIVEKITGFDIVTVMMTIVAVSAVALYYSIRYLYMTFADDQYADVISLVTFEVTFLPIVLFIKVYDIATAMFFTLSLAALARKKYWLFYALFPIATLNRETTFLLTMFFVIYLFQKIRIWHWIFGTLYQLSAFLAVKLLVNTRFADLPGYQFLWSWRLVLQTYTSRWAEALMLLVVAAVLIYLVFRRWKEKPEFLRSAFVLLFPSLLTLHMLLGMAFELRVFSEIIPVGIILALYPVRTQITKAAVSTAPQVNEK